MARLTLDFDARDGKFVSLRRIKDSADAVSAAPGLFSCLPAIVCAGDDHVSRDHHTTIGLKRMQTKSGTRRRAAQPVQASKGRPNSTTKRAPARPIVSTGRWLLKSEPDVFSWEMLVARGARGEPWTGVRNYLARNNMRAMKVGDLAFFYHSNIGKEIVGIARVIATAHPDPDDDSGTWECVDVEAFSALARPVSLADVKANAELAKMSLVTCMRLSVQPVLPAEWAEVCRMGGVEVTGPTQDDRPGTGIKRSTAGSGSPKPSRARTATTPASKAAKSKA